jgi:hypothetical protein
MDNFFLSLQNHYHKYKIQLFGHKLNSIAVFTNKDNNAMEYVLKAKAPNTLLLYIPVEKQEFGKVMAFGPDNGAMKLIGKAKLVHAKELLNKIQ